MCGIEDFSIELFIQMTLKTGTSVVTFKSTATTVTVADALICARSLTAKDQSGDVTAPAPPGL